MYINLFLNLCTLCEIYEYEGTAVHAVPTDFDFGVKTNKKTQKTRN